MNEHDGVWYVFKLLFAYLFIMRLYEFESKALLREYGIVTPRSFVFSSPNDPQMDKIDFPFPWYIKAQVPVGGREKAGGVVKVNDFGDAKTQIQLIFQKIINGYPVEKLLVEEAVFAKKEMYLSITIDRQECCYSILAGSQGGIDIETRAAEHPETIMRIQVSPLREIREFDILPISQHLGLETELVRHVVLAMHAIALAFDADLVEINPLIIAKKGLMALDAKIQVDDFALFRQPAIALLPPRGRTKEEEAAASLGLSYVSLSGNIGIICNGAGLTMSTMDLVKSKGGEPANFLDLGGGARSHEFKKGITFIMDNERVRVLFINIFGGITRCDEVAKGLADAVSEIGLKKPIVVRLAGTNENEGRQILEGIGISAFADSDDAAERAVTMVGDRQ